MGMLVGGLTAAMLACLFADSLSVGLDGWIISVQNIIPEEEDGLAWVPLSARSKLSGDMNTFEADVFIFSTVYLVLYCLYRIWHVTAICLG